jgi:hypothetical protein
MDWQLENGRSLSGIRAGVVGTDLKVVRLTPDLTRRETCIYEFVTISYAVHVLRYK